MSVEDMLTKNGHNTFTYGWTSGNTFRTGMFIEAVFYSEEVAKLFDDFMTAPNREINFNHLDAVIASIEAEEAVMATLLDKDGVIKDIAKLVTRPFVSVEDIDSVRYIEPPKVTVVDQSVRMKRSPKEFSGIFGDALPSAIDHRELRVVFTPVPCFISGY